MTEHTDLTSKLQKNLVERRPGLRDTLKAMHDGGDDHETILKACEHCGVKPGTFTHATIASMLRGWKYGYEKKEKKLWNKSR